ncbi:MAG: rhodanese-like domain-containing protein [Actinomycetota bacterium]
MQINDFPPADSVQVVDVRHLSEWDAGHLENSLHIPLKVLAENLSSLTKEQAILAVCRTGVRSRKAVDLLRSEGFDSENLEGGLQALNAAGHPLVTPDGKPGSLADYDEGGETLSPELAHLRDSFLEIAFGLQERFGDKERTEEDEREFLREWLADKGKSPQEIERALGAEA